VVSYSRKCPATINAMIAGGEILSEERALRFLGMGHFRAWGA
jgi:hypothetical protein